MSNPAAKAVAAAGEDSILKATKVVEDLYHLRDSYFPANPEDKISKLQQESDRALLLLDSIASEQNKSPVLSATFEYLRGKIMDVFPDYRREAEDHLSEAVKLNPSLADAWLCLRNCETVDLTSAKYCFNLGLSKIENRTESETSKVHAMNAGDGPNSYIRNSSRQATVIKAAKEFISEAVIKEFEIKKFLTSSTLISIADLGCSTGSNSILAIQYIVNSIESKYKPEDNSQVPEFQVLFNDNVTNDFNALFKFLPPERHYFAAAVPGSFYGRLFPRATIHFFHSSSSLHWLSGVPKSIMDQNSDAWNKGRVFYSKGPKQVVDAYAAQFAADLECFLSARSEETVPGGLVALSLPVIPDDIPKYDDLGMELDLIGSCLVDMVNMGVVNEEKVDSFNFPIYFPHIIELKTIIQRNENFSLKCFKKLNPPKDDMIMANADKHVMLKMLTAGRRAGLEGMIKQHFGSEIVDELFDRFSKKLAEVPEFLDPEKTKVSFAFVLLKREENA